MRMKGAHIAVGLAIALLFSGCEQPATQQEPAGAIVTEHMAVGTLNSIDQVAGTVNITHGPVPSAGWPEMTMSFKLADPNAAAELKAGERVDFHFEIESGMNATVTTITPLD
jgi:Cu(I)/Ag(I) efflux system periplasmic protein CusF